MIRDPTGTSTRYIYIEEDNLYEKHYIRSDQSQNLYLSVPTLVITVRSLDVSLVSRHSSPSQVNMRECFRADTEDGPDMSQLSWVSRMLGVGPRFQRTLVDLLAFGYKCR